MERNVSVLWDAPPSEEAYSRFVTDVWVCIALTLMVLSCVGLLCSCMLYHKLQQWKTHEERCSRNPDEGDLDSLPSYTLVTGLPTYEQAIAWIEQGRKFMVKDDDLKAELEGAKTTAKLDSVV